MPRELPWLLTIQHYCQFIIERTSGVTREQFLEDEGMQLMLTQCIELIAENVKKLPAEIREVHPEIDWQAIIGMRNILAHTYYECDFLQVWDALTRDVPALLAAVQAHIPEFPEG